MMSWVHVPRSVVQEGTTPGIKLALGESAQQRKGRQCISVHQLYINKEEHLGGSRVHEYQCPRTVHQSAV